MVMISRVERLTSESLFASMDIADEQYYRHDSGRFGSSTRPIEIESISCTCIDLYKSPLSVLISTLSLAYMRVSHAPHMYIQGTQPASGLLLISFRTASCSWSLGCLKSLLHSCRLHEVSHESTY